jgi:hypothetical protein
VAGELTICCAVKVKTNLEKFTLFEIYVQFLRGTQKFGAFSVAESLFPIDPLLWKALWESRSQYLKLYLNIKNSTEILKTIFKRCQTFININPTSI